MPTLKHPNDLYFVGGVIVVVFVIYLLALIADGAPKRWWRSWRLKWLKTAQYTEWANGRLYYSVKPSKQRKAYEFRRIYFCSELVNYQRLAKAIVSETPFSVGSEKSPIYFFVKENGRRNEGKYLRFRSLYDIDEGILSLELKFVSTAAQEDPKFIDRFFAIVESLSA